MQSDHHPAAFHFTNRPLELRVSVPDPPPERVALQVTIMGPESPDYNTIAGATVPFRFDRERDGVAEYRQATRTASDPADSAEVYVHVFMSPETAKLLHAGQLTAADVAAQLLGANAADMSAPSSDDEGLHGLTDAPGG
jgi:hypothetical protein